MNLEKIIEDFIGDNNLKSIVIDGPWGCGKTTVISDFIRKNSSKYKISYVSLFGLSSVDELNTKLYYSNKKHTNIHKIGNLISKAISIIPMKGYKISEGLDFVLGNLEKNYKAKNTIIIFDDFERIKNVDYVELMGYFNNLNLQLCKIICIVSSENIDENRIVEYNKFKEKVFDRIYRMDSVNNDVFKKMFEDFNIDSIDEKFCLFNNNIRLAKKTKDLYEEIINHIKVNNILLKENDRYLVFVNCIYAIISMFGSYMIITSNDSINDMTNVYNDNLINQKFFVIKDKEILNNLKSMINNDNYYKEMQITGFLDLLNCILKILYYKDYSSLDIFFNKEEDDDRNGILNRQFFYLSDKEKIMYYNDFVKTLDDNNKLTNEEIINCFTDIYAYSDFELTNSILEKFIKCIIGNHDNDSFNNVDILINVITSKVTNDHRNNKEFINNFRYIYNIECEKQGIEIFNSIVQRMDYIKLAAYIQNVHEGKKWLNDKLKDNDFYFPNLADSIDYEIWSYCHAIANYCKKTELSTDFIKKLQKILIENKDNYSLNDRVLTLTRIASLGKVNTIDDLRNI